MSEMRLHDPCGNRFYRHRKNIRLREGLRTLLLAAVVTACSLTPAYSEKSLNAWWWIDDFHKKRSTSETSNEPASAENSEELTALEEIQSVYLTARAALSEDDVPETTNLEPLSEYFDRPSDQKVPSYALLRCAGLYQGLLYYAGATFDEETANQYRSIVLRFELASAEARALRSQRQRGSALSKEQVKALVKDNTLQIQSVAFFFDGRMNENFRSTGNAMTGDDLIEGDIEYCITYLH